MSQKNMDESTKKFEEEVIKLIKLAKESGMSEKEIDDCIEEVLKDPELCKFMPVSELAFRYIRKAFNIFTKVMAVFTVITITSVTIYSIAPPSISNVMEKPFAGHYYLFQRFLRRLALPLHDYINLTQYYEATCIINNPFFDPKSLENETECAVCANLPTPLNQVDNNTTPASEAFILEDIVVYLGYTRRCPPKRLINFYTNHSDVLDVSQDGKVHESITSIMTLDDLTVKDKMTEFRTSWSTTNLTALKPVVRYPIEIPSEFKNVENVTFYAYGPNATDFDLFGNVANETYRIITQLYGSSDVLLSPKLDNCLSTCGQHRIILNAGHSIQFAGKVWGAMFSSNETDVVSLTTIMDFYIPPELIDAVTNRTSIPEQGLPPDEKIEL